MLPARPLPLQVFSGVKELENDYDFATTQVEDAAICPYISGHTYLHYCICMYLGIVGIVATSRSFMQSSDVSNSQRVLL